MTVYIFGGSNTAMKGGWGDGLASRLCRRMPVQNLALGATNSLNALIRLDTEVALQPGDVVVWANAINDAICLGNRDHDPRRMIEYVETMVRTCLSSGARFIPVLLDTYRRDLMIQQARYMQLIRRLMAHYGLDAVDLPAAYAAEMGTTLIPRHHFLDVLHLMPGGELCEFVSEMAADLVDKGEGYPLDQPPLFLTSDTRFELISVFEQADQREAFKNHLLDIDVWVPPISVRPKTEVLGVTEIEAVTVIADIRSGRFTMRVGDQTVPLSATHQFPRTGRPIALTACVPLLAPEGVQVQPGQTVAFDWASEVEPIPVDTYFLPLPAAQHSSTTHARVVSILLRHRSA